MLYAVSRQFGVIHNQPEGGQTMQLSSKESIVTMIAKGLAGGDWPASAMFKVEYRSKTTAQEWGEVQTEFFYSKEEMDNWVTEIVDWTTDDGNHFEYHLYEWEHGPKYVTTVMFP